jgi:fatty-acyl-CoA synthase
VAVPLFHILGLLMSYAYLCRGATVCLPDNYKPETLVREIDAYRISDMAAVGAIYLSLADAEGFEKNVVPNLHLCMIAGGMSTPVQMMRLELQYANATFINMYGQSEAAPLTMVRPSDMVEKRAQTVGQAIGGMDIRISDGKGGFLPQGEIGEVVARGGNLMNGYDRLPREKQPIDEDGWLHTGDLGFFDEDGYLYLAGRIKDVIIRGGENISPSEIESALNRMENIREAKVMGAPHPIYGESVEACVTMTDGGASFDQEALKKALRSVIARYKVPSHIFLYDSFPLNVNGKLDQRALHADMLNRLLRLSVDEELAGGVTVFDVVVRNSSYAIVPVTSMASELAQAVGFSRRRLLSIRLAVEEMLTERIMDAYSAAGNIRVRITLMPEWLRISFSDDGAEYFIDKRRDTSMSAKIILKAVSDFHTDYPAGKPVYCMDFLYENEFSIQEFLMKSKEENDA